MPTLTCPPASVHRVLPVVLLGALLPGVLAAQAPTLSARMTSLEGAALTVTECRNRLQTLGAMLEEAGYAPPRTWELQDGTLAARWDHRATRHTVLVFAGQQATDNRFSVSEYTGPLAANALVAVP